MFENAGLNSVLAALALGLPSLTLAVALDKRTDGCDELLSAGLTTQVYFPGTTNYTTREESYWSLDSQLGPTCIVQPRNTAEVAAVMKVLATADGNFAVRSGGHSHWAGGSDIHTGVTIDLGLMTGVTYNPDTSLASIEPGPNWGQVYTTLAAEGAMVVGGRDAGVGVGGFLTGGDYSGKMGLACDTIINMEMVLADGSIVNANATSNADLWKAMKGGSGNFGIVTRFDVEAFPVVDLWGGLRVANRTLYGDQAITSMVNFANDNEQNPQDAYIINFTYNPGSFTGVVLASVIVDTDGVVNASAFDEVYKIPTIAEDLQTRSMYNIAETYILNSGSYNTWFSLTFRNDASIMTYAASLHDELVATLLTLIPAANFVTQCLFQPMPTYVADISVSKGGNVLGLDSEKNNALLWLLTGAFTTAAEEAIARPYLANFSASVEAYAESIGSNVAWRYLNYVDPTEDPLASYGTDNIAFMKNVSAKYDPTGVFQSKSPAGFKLSAM